MIFRRSSDADDHEVNQLTKSQKLLQYKQKAVKSLQKLFKMITPSSDKKRLPTPTSDLLRGKQHLT